MTDEERDLIRKNAARVGDITSILAKVPSELLLLFKTKCAFPSRVAHAHMHAHTHAHRTTRVPNRT